MATVMGIVTRAMVVRLLTDLPGDFSSIRNERLAQRRDGQWSVRDTPKSRASAS